MFEMGAEVPCHGKDSSRKGTIHHTAKGSGQEYHGDSTGNEGVWETDTKTARVLTNAAFWKDKIDTRDFLGSRIKEASNWILSSAA